MDHRSVKKVSSQFFILGFLRPVRLKFWRMEGLTGKLFSIVILFLVSFFACSAKENQRQKSKRLLDFWYGNPDSKMKEKYTE